MKEFILNQENILRQKYQKKWDAHNVYAKHIGQEKENLNNFIFCVFQIDSMSRTIVKSEHIAVLKEN
jgi:hypothetical protein